MNPIYQAMMQNQPQNLAQRVESFKQTMQAQGITDPRTEVMRRMQTMAIPPQLQQKLQSTAQLMGISLF